MEPSAEVIGRELAPGERLLWSGQPPRGLRLRLTDLYSIPFALGWTAFTVAALVSLLTREDATEGAMIGVPLVSVMAAGGVYLLVGRFWVDAYWRRATCYGITSERVLVVTAWFGRLSIHSLALRLVAEARLTVYRGGGGRIEFASVLPGGNSGSDWPAYYAAGLVSLELATEARSVYEIVRQVQRPAA
jgi:hypothetical protein